MCDEFWKNSGRKSPTNSKRAWGAILRKKFVTTYLRDERNTVWTDDTGGHHLVNLGLSRALLEPLLTVTRLAEGQVVVTSLRNDVTFDGVGKREGDEGMLVEDGTCRVRCIDVELRIVVFTELEVAPGIELGCRAFRELDEGAFGRVYEAVLGLTGQRCVLKIDRFAADDDQSPVARRSRSAMRNEIELLARLRHPNLIALLHSCSQDAWAHLVVELGEGGTLMERANEQGGIDEDVGRHIIRQVMAGLAYLHAEGVIHKDVKPDNVVLMSHERLPRAKLIDLGCACPAQASWDHGGAFAFMPPVVLKSRITKTRLAFGTGVDVWSAGVVTYCCLCTRMPFMYAARIDCFYDEVKQGNVITNYFKFKVLSDHAKNFIFECLAVEEKDRSSAERLLHHPWIESNAFFMKSDSDLLS